MSEITVGDRVRVKPLAAIGTVLRISTMLRHTPYLVDVIGYGTRGYSADDLEKLPTGTVLDLPPAGAPQPGWAQFCGSCGAVMAGGRCPRCRP